VTAPSLITKIAKYFPIVEVIALAGFTTGFFFKTLHYSGGNDILLLSLSALSIIYFLTAYVPREAPKEDEAQSSQPMGFAALLGRTILPKVLWIGSSVSVIGILFTLLHFNGFRDMLLIGTSTLAIASVLGLVNTMSDEQGRKALGPMLLRAVPLILVCIYLLMVYGIARPAF